MDDLLDQLFEDHINSDLTDEFADDSFGDEPRDEILAQQELEDFEQADEYFGHYGDDW